MNSKSAAGPSLLPAPDRAKFVRLAFTLVSDGAPVADILHTINAAGLKGAKGGHLSLQSVSELRGKLERLADAFIYEQVLRTPAFHRGRPPPDRAGARRDVPRTGPWKRGS